MIELLQELRIVIPGVQILFAFLLTVPFSQGFSKLDSLQRGVFFATLLCTAAATVPLTVSLLPSPAPRPPGGQGAAGANGQPVRDPQAGIPRAGHGGVLFVITDLTFGSVAAIIVTLFFVLL